MAQPTKPSQPSTEAFEAAKSITSTKMWLADHTWDDKEAAEGFEQQLAEIIDDAYRDREKG